MRMGRAEKFGWEGFRFQSGNLLVYAFAHGRILPLRGRRGSRWPKVESVRLSRQSLAILCDATRGGRRRFRSSSCLGASAFTPRFARLKAAIMNGDPTF